MNVDIRSNDSVKLQGPLYNLDCYNFWDLNHCADNFKSQKYYKHLSSLQTKANPYYNEHRALAVVDFKKYNFEYQKYYDLLPKNVRRDIALSKRSNFYFKKYDFNRHVYDFSEINNSQRDKKGSINPWYLQAPSFFLGSHSHGKHAWEDDKHHGTWYGLFKYFKHYKQGVVTTNEKLFAYCKVLVDGEMATIGLIWMHAGHQNKGLGYHLITAVVKDVIQNKKIKCLVYSCANQYPKWKSRMLFEPIPIVINL
jgi:hypothetical protein